MSPRSPKLQGLKEPFPRRNQLIEQRESLRAIVEDKTIPDAKSGQEQFQGWMEQAKASGQKAFSKFCKTLGNGL